MTYIERLENLKVNMTLTDISTAKEADLVFELPEE